MKARVFSIVVAVLFWTQSVILAENKGQGQVNGVFVGMSQDKFKRIYPKKEARTYRHDGGEEWITFSDPFKGRVTGVITFYLQDGKVKEWRLNDRDEVIEEYLGEFCSQSIVQGLDKIHAAIKDVLKRIPSDAFLNVTDRARPVLFTEFYDSGTARFAGTSEIFSSKDDAPAFQGGITIMKLGTALNEAETPAPIEGIVAHEIAHRILEHAQRPKLTCEAEREANRLIKQWGFEAEYKAASKMFGHKEGDSASCQEEK